jgi:hypothetical protein
MEYSCERQFLLHQLRKELNDALENFFFEPWQFVLILKLSGSLKTTVYLMASLVLGLI